ncbi:MAG TPA: GntR family transcriptional regulator [Allosphingosinicella sp.]|nr:GntR family transcriptional regulator [Allosphingosinicella sp.]
MTQAGLRTGEDGERGEEAPLYQMVVRALKAEILRGVPPVGALLPSEAVLTARFGVSRHTIREAVRHLRDLGLVESRQGLGTIVLKPGGPNTYVHQVNSIDDLHDFNVESRYDEEVENLVADEALAKRLGGKPGERWMKINGMRFDQMTGAPICAVEIFVASRFAGIARLMGRRSGPIYALIEAVYGESIFEVEQDLRVAPLDRKLAAKLDAAPGETVVEIKRTYRLSDSFPAEITFNHYKGSNFSFSINLKRVRA